MSAEWTFLFLVAGLFAFAVAASGRAGMFATVRLVAVGLACWLIPTLWTVGDQAFR